MILPPAGHACEPESARYSSGRARLAFAERRDGTIAHVSEVVSGLNCDCVCPACGYPVVARRGRIVEHHFAHHVLRNCRYAAETALHKFAKQVLERHRRILVPEIKAEQDGQCLVAHKGGDYEVDEVILERRLTGLVPDVIVRKGGRELLVEIFVTHACDEKKLQRIREQGIAAIEIDLSDYTNDFTPESVEDAILRSAPRKWLYNRKLESAAEKLRAHIKERAAQKQEEVARKADTLSTVIEQARSGKFQCGIPRVAVAAKRVQVEGYGSAIGAEIVGNLCFVVEPGQWQAFVFESVLAATQGSGLRSVRTKAVFDQVRKAGLIAAPFDRYIGDEIEAALTNRGIEFQSAYRAVESYLEHLEELGFIGRSFDGWRATQEFEREIQGRRRVAQLRTDRREAVHAIVVRLVAKLPGDEKSGFSLESWFTGLQPSFGASFADAIEKDMPDFALMKSALDKIESMVFHGWGIADELLGLPLARERERQKDARALREAERRWVEQEAKRREAERRVKEITERAQVLLGPDGGPWLRASCRDLNDRPPEAVSSESAAGLQSALHALNSESSRREKALEAEGRARELRAKLTEDAYRLLPPDRAELFLKSSHPQLGKRRPIEFCIDEPTYHGCISLLQSLRRPRR